MITRCFHSRIY